MPCHTAGTWPFPMVLRESAGALQALSAMERLVENGFGLLDLIWKASYVLERWACRSECDYTL